MAEDCVTDDIRTAAAEPVIVSGRMRFSDVLRFEADGRTDRRTDGRKDDDRVATLTDGLTDRRTAGN